MPFHDNGLLFLTTSIVSQIYDLEHDSRCERHTVFTLKCFRRHMLLEICSKCEILLKCCPKCEKVLQTQKSAQKVLSAIGKGLNVEIRKKVTRIFCGFLFATVTGNWLGSGKRHQSSFQ